MEGLRLRRTMLTMHPTLHTVNAIEHMADLDRTADDERRIPAAGRDDQPPRPPDRRLVLSLRRLRPAV